MNRGTRSLDQDTAQEWPLAVGIRNIERFVCNNPYTTRFKASTATCQMQVAARSDGHSRARAWCPRRHWWNMALLEGRTSTTQLAWIERSPRKAEYRTQVKVNETFRLDGADKTVQIGDLI